MYDQLVRNYSHITEDIYYTGRSLFHLPSTTGAHGNKPFQEHAYSMVPRSSTRNARETRVHESPYCSKRSGHRICGEVAVTSHCNSYHISRFLVRGCGSSVYRSDWWPIDWLHDCWLVCSHQKYWPYLMLFYRIHDICVWGLLGSRWSFESGGSVTQCSTLASTSAFGFPLMHKSWCIATGTSLWNTYIS